MSVVLSKNLLRAINHVNNDVAHEIEIEDEEDSNAADLILAETCIDANRLTFWGYPEADAELKELITKHGYNEVLSEVAKHVSY